MVALNFNAQNVAPNTALEPIPTGQYPVVITSSQEKPTKSGNGSFIEFEMTIQGGQHNGRKVFDRLNINNPNATAVDIAYRTLSAICHVTGCHAIQDTSQLHGRPFTVVVVKKQRQDDPSQMTNEVKGYKDINGNDPGQGGQVAQPQAQPGWAQNAAQPAPQAPPQYAPQQAPAAAQPPAQPPQWAGNVQQPVQQAPANTAQAQAPAPAAQAPAGPAGAGAPPPWAQPGQAA